MPLPSSLRYVRKGVLAVTPAITRWEYKVIELRERMIGSKQSGAQLEAALNEYGRQGWRAMSVVKADIKGRIGPGGVEGLLVTFERPLPS
jgi:hypothetical protein